MLLRVTEYVNDRSPLAWWADGVSSSGLVRGWLPDRFEVYVRLFHPARFEGTDRWVRWAELATRSRKTLSATTSIRDLTDPFDPNGSGHARLTLPMSGQLVRPYADRLMDIVSAATDSSDFWLLVWSDFLAQTGQLDSLGAVEINNTWVGSGRDYVLGKGLMHGGRGSSEEGLMFQQPPTFVWPSDRAWFMATDIDSVSTYVGGSAELAAQLRDDELLEAMPVSLDDPYDGLPEASR
jgi:hypothetical protein